MFNELFIEGEIVRGIEATAVLIGGYRDAAAVQPGDTAVQLFHRTFHIEKGNHADVHEPFRVGPAEGIVIVVRDAAYRGGLSRPESEEDRGGLAERLDTDTVLIHEAQAYLD